MTKVHIREALGTGWQGFKRRPWFLLGIALGVIGMFVLTSMESAVATALGYIVYGGYLAVMLRHSNGEQIVFDDLFSIDSRWISFAFLGVIKGVLIFVGLLLFIVPGIYLAVRFMFAELLVIDKGMRPIEALRESGAMTKGNMWKLFLFTIVGVLLFLLGLIALGVGAAVAWVVLTLASIKLYKELGAQEETASIQQ